MSNQDARNFLESIGTFLNSGTGSGGGSAANGFKLATIGGFNNEGLATVIFDGENQTSAKGYAWTYGYAPVSGDRVYLIPINNSYLIGGKVQTGGMGASSYEQHTGTLVAGAERPAGMPYKRFSGYVSTSTGAGGENRTATPATDAAGTGGFWFGYQGLPTFQGIYSIQLTGIHPQDQFRYYVSVGQVSLTRFTWQGTRLSGGGYTNGYGGLSMFVEILGW